MRFEKYKLMQQITLMCQLSYITIFSFMIFVLFKTVSLKLLLKTIKYTNTLKSDIKQSHLKLILKNIKIISRFLPWMSNCFVKALTLHHILSYNGIQSKIKVSVYGNNNTLIHGHAYIEISNNITLFRIKRFKDICYLI